MEPAPSSFKDNTANNERIIKDSNQSNISTGNNPEYIDFFCERNEGKSNKSYIMSDLIIFKI